MQQMTDDPMTMTDEQLAAQLAEREAHVRRARARYELLGAAELVRHVRALALPTDGRGEPGEVYRPQSSPLPVSKVDDADGAYGWMLEWAHYWSEQLQVKLPTQAVISYTGDPGLHLGFRAGVTPDGAHGLTRMLAMWLLLRFDAIAEHEQGADFFETVFVMFRGLANRYPMEALEPHRQRPVDPRQCPTCGSWEVGAHWPSDDPKAVLDVEIGCGHCGETIVTRRSQIERTLGETVCSHVVPVDLVAESSPTGGRCERCAVELAAEISEWVT